MSRPALNIAGKRFGMLTVIERVVADSNGYARWLCRCDCGGQTIVISQSLRRGATQSCGCLRKHRRPFRGVKPSMTPAERSAKKIAARRNKLAAVAAGGRVSDGEREMMDRVLIVLETLGASTIAEIAVEIEVTNASANNYVALLCAQRRVELAGRVRRGSRAVDAWRLAGTNESPRNDAERFSGLALASALGYDMVPMPVGGRVYRIDDDREAA